MIDSGRSLAARAFARIGRDDITGMSAMVAYNLAISFVPLAVLALWVADWVVGSKEFEQAVIRDLTAIFPGEDNATLTTLFDRLKSAAPETGAIALVLSIWTGMSFWGSIDTSFRRIYDLPSRGWVGQKRFSLAMIWLVVLFMGTTVAVPAAQSSLAAVRSNLPFGLADVPGLTLATSLAVGILLLFLTLWAIFAFGPNSHLSVKAVLPGALVATVAIVVLDVVYPYYLTHVSAFWRFGTTVVLLVITLAWFYALAFVILLAAELNAWLMRRQMAKSDLAGELPTRSNQVA